MRSWSQKVTKAAASGVAAAAEGGGEAVPTCRGGRFASSATAAGERGARAQPSFRAATRACTEASPATACSSRAFAAVALPAPAVLQTPKGLEHVGPRAFGYDLEFKSVFAS